MPIRFLIWLAAFSCALPCLAQAGADDVLVVRVEDPQAILDPVQVRADVERDLGVDTIDPSVGSDLSAGATLRISIASSGEAQIEFQFGATRRARTVALPTDRDEALRVVVLIGANLVREESADLLARMARASEGSDAAPAEEPAAAAGEVVTPETTRAAPSAEEPAALADHDAADDEAPVTPGPSPWSRESTEEYPGRYAITHRGGAAPSDGQAAGFFIWGFEFGYAPHPMLTLGVTDLTASGGYSSLEGTIFAGGGTLFGELGGFVDPRIQFYGRLGLALQGRLNPPPPAGGFQMAISVGAGVRLFATRRLFFAFELGANVVLTDSYAMGTGTAVNLPQGSTPASASMAVGWQF